MIRFGRTPGRCQFALISWELLERVDEEDSTTGSYIDVEPQGAVSVSNSRHTLTLLYHNVSHLSY